MRLLQYLQLIENIPKHKLNHLQILHFASLLNQLLDSLQKTFLLMLPDGNRKIIFDIFELPVQNFKLIDVLKGIWQW